jgi:hypothetical protein
MRHEGKCKGCARPAYICVKGFDERSCRDLGGVLECGFAVSNWQEAATFSEGNFARLDNG